MAEQRDEQKTDRTPPEIVAASGCPEIALSAFIAQELEHWGFEITEGGAPGRLLVQDLDLVIAVEIA